MSQIIFFILIIIIKKIVQFHKGTERAGCTIFQILSALNWNLVPEIWLAPHYLRNCNTPLAHDVLYGLAPRITVQIYHLHRLVSTAMIKSGVQENHNHWDPTDRKSKRSSSNLTVRLVRCRRGSMVKDVMFQKERPVTVPRVELGFFKVECRSG